MFKKRRRVPNTPFEEMSVVDLIKQLIISKLPKRKKPVSHSPLDPIKRLPGNEITHIAIVLDGVVEDVMRAQNRLGALLLSGPEFIEFNPQEENIQISLTNYKNGKFYQPEQQLMTDEELSDTIAKMTGENNENKK